MKRDVGYEGFCGRQEQCRVIGQKVNGEHVEHRWNHLTFILPLYPCGQRSSFVLSPFKHTVLELFLAPWLPGYLIMIAGNGLTQNLCL